MLLPRHLRGAFDRVVAEGEDGAIYLILVFLRTEMSEETAEDIYVDGHRSFARWFFFCAPCDVRREQWHRFIIDGDFVSGRQCVVADGVSVVIHATGPDVADDNFIN